MTKRTKYLTPTQAATKTTRALISATYPGVTGITVTTRLGFGTAACLVTYPEGTDYQVLEEAATEAGALGIISGSMAMTINWKA